MCNSKDACWLRCFAHGVLFLRALLHIPAAHSRIRLTDHHTVITEEERVILIKTLEAFWSLDAAKVCFGKPHIAAFTLNPSKATAVLESPERARLCHGIGGPHDALLMWSVDEQLSDSNSHIHSQPRGGDLPTRRYRLGYLHSAFEVIFV